MDKLANALREDAEKIEVSVSADLDKRLHASIEHSPPRRPKPKRTTARVGWASALTGVTAAVAVLLVINWNRPEAPATVVPPLASVAGALPRLNAETAVLTAPLTKELENLEADLKKAEEAVKREIGLSM